MKTKTEILATKRLIIKDGIEWIPMRHAEMAMEFHKAEKYKIWEEDHKREPSIYDEFGYFERWSIEPIKLQD